MWLELAAPPTIPAIKMSPPLPTWLMVCSHSGPQRQGQADSAPYPSDQLQSLQFIMAVLDNLHSPFLPFLIPVTEEGWVTPWCSPSEVNHALWEEGEGVCCSPPPLC